jgi:WD40 repeat protein
MQLAVTMSAIEWANPGHNNRVICVKFVPEDPQLLLSGGWDQTVNIWVKDKNN